MWFRSSTLVILNCADLQQLKIKTWSFGETPPALFHLLDEDQTLHSSIWFILYFAPKLTASDCSRWMHSSLLPVCSGRSNLFPENFGWRVPWYYFVWNSTHSRQWRKTMLKTTAPGEGHARLMPSNTCPLVPATESTAVMDCNTAPSLLQANWTENMK